MWKCPTALETIKVEQQRREERKALQVRIADRAKRERVFEVPGRSHSTARAIPGAEMWRAFIDGSQTWERFWTCPYDPDNKIVIQVRPAEVYMPVQLLPQHACNLSTCGLYHT